MIRGILFDIGDTLLPASAIQRNALKAVALKLRQANLIRNDQAFEAAYRRADTDPSLADEVNVNHLYSGERIIDKALEFFLEPTGSDLSNRFLDLYRAEVRDAISSSHRLIALFSDLQSQDIRLGIASNGTGREQREQLSRMGIQKFFNPILISEEVGFAKPKPEFFLLASDLWHLPRDHVLVVGDRVDWEVVGAHDAHMQSGLVTEFVDNSKDIRPDLRPDFLIPRLEDLSRLVRSQNGS